MSDGLKLMYPFQAGPELLGKERGSDHETWLRWDGDMRTRERERKYKL